jgi:hypothetical protein
LLYLVVLLASTMRGFRPPFVPLESIHRVGSI